MIEYVIKEGRNNHSLILIRIFSNDKHWYCVPAILFIKDKNDKLLVSEMKVMNTPYNSVSHYTYTKLQN